MNEPGAQGGAKAEGPRIGAAQGVQFGSWNVQSNFYLLDAAPASAGDASQRLQSMLRDDGSGLISSTVREFTEWRRLGVHRPLAPSVADLGVSRAHDSDRQLPAYVLREKDRRELRPLLARIAEANEAAAHLVLITGESAAGKTRAAMEAMRSELSDWRLLVPRSARQLTRVLGQGFSFERTVVWLDEIHEILTQERGVEELDRLLDLRDGPCVLLATLRTDAENSLRDTPAWNRLDRGAFRIVLSRRPPRDEMEIELGRARDLDDPWVNEALKRIGDRYGIAEWIAAGPQVLRAFERARTSSSTVELVGAAIVNAAVDCYRAGYTTTIPAQLLQSSFDLYLSPGVRQRSASEGAFQAGLEWATKPVAGAVGLLQVEGPNEYRAFDYLLDPVEQHGLNEINPGLWPVLVDFVTPETLETVAIAADRCGRSVEARTLAARMPSAALYRALDDMDGLRRLSDGGDWYAARYLVELLGRNRDLELLEDIADDHGGGAIGWGVPRDEARRRLAAILAENGDVESLQRRADAHDDEAAGELANLLAAQGRIEDLRDRAARGDWCAGRRLVEHVIAQRDTAWLVELAESAGQRGWEGLIDRLAEVGDLAGLELFARHGRLRARIHLATLKGIRCGDLDELREIADSGDDYAASQLAVALERVNETDELIRRAGSGDDFARAAAIRVLASTADVERLRTVSEPADEDVRQLIVEVAAEHGNVALLARVADGGDFLAADALARLLGKRKDRAALEARAESGDFVAVNELERLLADTDDLQELTDQAKAGNRYATTALLQILEKSGDVAALAKYADELNEPSAKSRLAYLLADRGDVEQLTIRADAGDKFAANSLARLLSRLGDMEQLARRADAGDWMAAIKLADLAAARGDRETLTARADAGDLFALDRLHHLLYARGQRERPSVRTRIARRLAGWRSTPPPI